MPGGPVIRWWAACASLGAGLIHLAVVSEHVSEWWLYGLFFLVVGVVQIGWAVQAMESHPLPVPRLFAAANAVIGLWFVSRTTGLPVGPEAWGRGREHRGFPCAALEAVVVVLLVLTVRRPRVQSRRLSPRCSAAWSPSAVAAAAVTVAALAANRPCGHATHHPHGVHSVRW
jgi:hypothetical protein